MFDVVQQPERLAIYALIVASYTIVLFSHRLLKTSVAFFAYRQDLSFIIKTGRLLDTTRQLVTSVLERGPSSQGRHVGTDVVAWLPFFKFLSATTKLSLLPPTFHTSSLLDFHNLVP